MPLKTITRLGIGLALVVVLAFVPACSEEEPEDESDKMVFGQTVQGKVTYDGKPVPYGYVLFFHAVEHMDEKTGEISPVSTAEISEGRYKATDVPTGPMKVCVATNPDVNAEELVKPISMDVGKLPPDQGGQVGGSAGPPGTLPGSAPGTPPGAPPGTPPDMGFIGHPILAKLTKSQKATLRKIHKEYGTFDKSAIAYPVREGDQTFDIVLPMK